MSENRALRVELSVNASAYITGMNRAAEATKNIAREALGVRTALATITPEANKLDASLRRLSIPSAFIRDIRSLSGPNAGLTTAATDIRRLASAVNSINPSHATGLRDVGTALHGIGSLGAGLTTAVGDIRRVSSALGSITPASAAGMRDLGTALHGIGSLSVGGAAAEITAMSTGVRRLVRDANSVPALRALATALRDLGAAGGGLGNLGNAGNALRGMQSQIDQLRRSIAGLRGAAGGGPGGGSGSSGGILGQIFGGAALGNLASNVAFSAFSRIGAGIRSTVKATADYETELKTFGAVTKASNGQMQQAGDLAIKLGGDVSIAGASASDAASVLVELAKGGLSVDSSFAAAKGTLQLAAAATVGVGVAAGIQTAALNMFSLGAGEAGKVADILSNTAAAASGEITDFAEGMKYTGVQAHGLGMTLTDTSAGLAVLAQAGEKGSIAGTNLNDMLLRLNPQTKKTKNAMKELGVVGFDVNGQFVGTPKIINQLTEAHKRLSPAAFEAATKMAFGTQGMRAAGIFAEKGAGAYTDMTKAITTGAGAAAFSTAKMSGLGGAFKNVQNQVETAQVVIGEKFSGALQTMLGGISRAIPKITAFLTGGALGGGLSSIGSWFKPLTDGAAELATKALPYVKTFIDSIASGFGSVVTFVKPVADAIGGFFKSMASNGVLDTVGGALTGLGHGFEGLMKWLAPVGKVLGNVIGFIGGLPTPIYAGAAALGAFLLLRGPMNALFLQLIMGYARVGVAAQGMVSAGLLGNIKQIGAGLLGAFGGPLGLAITAAGAGLAWFMSRTHDSTIATHDFTGAIDANTGALTDNAAQTTAASLKDTLVAFKAAGGNVKDYTDAVMGNTDAQARVTAQIRSMNSAAVEGTPTWQKFSAQYSKAGITSTLVADAMTNGGAALQDLKQKYAAGGLQKTIGDFSTGIGNVGGALTKTAGIQTQYGRDVLKFASDMNAGKVTAEASAKSFDAATGAATRGSGGMKLMGSNTGDMTVALEAARISAGKTGHAVGALGDDAEASGKKAKTAEQKYWDWATHVSGIRIKLNTKGQFDSFETDTQRAFDGFKTAASEAATQADLFWFAMTDPTKITATQTIYADAAAIRALGAAFRDEAANKAAVVSAKAAVDTAKAGHVGTQAEVTAAQDKATISADALAKATARLKKMQESGKASAADLAAQQAKVDQAQTAATKSADAASTAQQNVGQQIKGAGANAAETAAKQRDLAAANDRAADSEAAIFEAQVKVGETAAKRIQQIGTETEKSKGHAAAIAAVTAYLTTERASFIAAQPQADILSGKAAKAADTIGLIPKNATIIFDSDSKNLLIGAAEVKKAADAAAAARTAKFNADTKGAIADIAAFGGDVASIPKSYRTVFDAQVATASKNGQNLYNIYNRTTGNWTAQFLTPNQAAAKLKVGYLVDQYDKAKGTWTAKFATPNEAAAKTAAIGVVTEYSKARGTWAAMFATPNQAAAKGIAIGVVNQYDKARGTWTANLSALDNASKKIDAVKASLDGIQNKVVTLEVRQSGTSGQIVYKAPSGQQFQASGGYIHGAGTGTSDSIPAWLSNGEYVVKASQTAKHRPLLESINSGAERFATGGMVGSLGSTKINMIATGANPGAAGASAIASLFGQADSAASAATAAAKTATASAGAIPKANSAGVEQWRALALSVAAAKGEEPASVQVMLNQMSRESSGNPAAINLTDINAQRGTPSVGLLQFIPATFQRNADPGFNTNIYDPASQMHAWYNYLAADYGGWQAYAHRSGDTYGAYADGGLVRGAGSSRSDSNLARVSNGEYIVNAASTSQHLPLLHSINGYASGGLVGSQTALAGRTAASLGPELANVVQALQDIAQAVADARQAVRDKSALAVTARGLAGQNEDALRQAIQSRASKDIIAQARVRAAGSAQDYRTALRTYVSYRNAAGAADAFQRSQQRAFQTQQAYAAQVDKLNGWLTDRSAKLGQLQSERANMMGGISSTVAGFDGGILGHPDTRNTFATILKGQQYDAAQAQKFNVDITKLRKLGLSNTSLNSIASAGVDGGGVTAAALAKATPAQIKQLNAVGTQLHRIGDNVGNVVGGAFYDAGIQSATGFVKGLQSQIGAIQKAMNSIATSVVKTLTTKLQIHSPSRVMHGHGLNIVAGLNNGLLSGSGAVASTMAGMVQVPQPFIPQQNFGRSSGGSQSIDVQVFLDGKRIDERVDVKINGFAVDLGHAFEKAGMQR